MSRETAYAQFSYTPKNQHLHAHHPHHHQYAQQQNQYATTPQGDLIVQTTSGTSNAQYVNTSIALAQTRRYNTSIAPPTPNTPRQYPSTHPSIAPPLTEHPPSPSQCLPTNNVASISSSISSSLPASLPTPPPIVPAGLSSPNSGNVAATFDLQVIIAQYGSQPELLKLILTSKVEEDKRKAEEAKLRVRELDLMLYERDKQRKIINHVDEPKNEEIHSNQDIDYENDNSIGTFPTTDGTLNYASFGTNLSSPVQNLSLNSPSNTVSQSTPRIKPSLKGTLNDQNIIETAEHDESTINGTSNKRKRKRREMLPVTMIVETKEYPYDDGYLWKNNGNTTQRKTGNKSVYFKCSNSNKGCPVNKTVTKIQDPDNKEPPKYLIKYRGCHCKCCGNIKHIKIKEIKEKEI